MAALPPFTRNSTKFRSYFTVGHHPLSVLSPSALFTVYGSLTLREFSYLSAGLKIGTASLLLVKPLKLNKKLF
jgi:hypothetical protein